MAEQLDIEKYSRQLMFGIIECEELLEQRHLHEEGYQGAKRRLQAFTEMQEVMRLASCNVYEHSENLSDNSSPSEYFKSLFPIRGEEYYKIIKGIEAYFDQDLIRSKELDWMHIDAAVYATYRYTEYSENQALLKKYEPLYHEVFSKDSEYVIIKAVLVFGWGIIKWLAWLAAIIILYAAEEPLFASLLLAIKVILFFKRRRSFRVDNELKANKLKLVARAYSNLSKTLYNKSLLLSDLLQCRNSGLHIPNSLFEQIEKAEKLGRGDGFGPPSSSHFHIAA